jgi:hypothetical protein
MTIASSKIARLAAIPASRARAAARCGAMLFLLAALGVLAAPTRAADIVKANNTDGMANGTSWVGGVAPTASDTGIIDATFTETGRFGTGAPLSWLGMQVTGGTSSIDIDNTSNENWVGLGAGGLLMSSTSRTMNITSL